jgi:hypothetical protein
MKYLVSYRRVELNSNGRHVCSSGWHVFSCLMTMEKNLIIPLQTTIICIIVQTHVPFSTPIRCGYIALFSRFSLFLFIFRRYHYFLGYLTYPMLFNSTKNIFYCCKQSLQHSAPIRNKRLQLLSRVAKTLTDKHLWLRRQQA